jgi:hypothetical protein
MAYNPVDGVSIGDVTLQLDPGDNVAIAKVRLEHGMLLAFEPGASVEGVLLVQGHDLGAIPAGHKIALRELRPGEAVLRYGEVIGFATARISPGAHVHTHNLSAEEFSRSVDGQPERRRDLGLRGLPRGEDRTFLGFSRADGRWAPGTMGPCCRPSVARRMWPDASPAILPQGG